jgi:hypothetical protein
VNKEPLETQKVDSKLKQSLLSVPEVKLFAGDEQTDEIEQVLAAAGQIVPLAQPVVDLSGLVRSSFLATRKVSTERKSKRIGEPECKTQTVTSSHDSTR